MKNKQKCLELQLKNSEKWLKNQETPKMLVISMLSDAQEQEAIGSSNRRTLNAVKYIIDNYFVKA